MYNLIQSRAKTLLLWGSIEALLGGLAWQSYRKPRCLCPPFSAVTAEPAATEAIIVSHLDHPGSVCLNVSLEFSTGFGGYA
ncbi:hypothetical protein BJ165DRAFT_1522039 [Panaeolus papilionaceus]|nr:hypothetical protein BJ165DRAFT_1522039 [Panaeolus papilionaceus]